MLEGFYLHYSKYPISFFYSSHLLVFVHEARELDLLSLISREKIELGAKMVDPVEPFFRFATKTLDPRLGHGG